MFKLSIPNLKKFSLTYCKSIQHKHKITHENNKNKKERKEEKLDLF